MAEFKAGDIVKYDNGKLDYIFKCSDGVLGVNACNIAWIERGLRDYGDELYPLDTVDMCDAEVVDHYGDGTSMDGCWWYRANKNYVD